MQNKKQQHSDSQMYVYTQKIIQEQIHFKLGDKTSICIYNKYADDHIIYLFKKKKTFTFWTERSPLPNIF